MYQNRDASLKVIQIYQQNRISYELNKYVRNYETKTINLSAHKFEL